MELKFSKDLSRWLRASKLAGVGPCSVLNSFLAVGEGATWFLEWLPSRSVTGRLSKDLVLIAWRLSLWTAYSGLLCLLESFLERLWELINFVG